MGFPEPSSNATSSAVTSILPARSGEYYGPPGFTGSAAQAAGTLNLMTAAPVFLKAGTTIDRLAVVVIGSNTASETDRLGIYSDDGTGYPSALLLDGGEADISAVGVRSVTVSQAIATTGLYWLVSVRHGPSALGQLAVSASNTIVGQGMPAASTSFPYQQTAGYSQAGVTGALPANFSTSVTKLNASINNVLPFVYFRLA